MKKIYLLTIVLMLFTGLSMQAQQRGGERQRPNPEAQAQRMVQRMNEELKLTDKQQTDLKTLFTDTYKKRLQLVDKKQVDRDALMEQVKKDKEATDAKVKAILTADQYKKYQANEKKREQQRAERARAGQMPGRGR